MEDINLVPIEKFVLQCNEILGGKFLDLRQQLDLLMQKIIESDEIMAYLADALENFDHEANFELAFPNSEKVTINLPKEEKERLALTVGIFNDIDNGKLNITKFLESYFRIGNGTPVQNFLTLIIKPFRDLIAKHFDIDVNITKKDIEKHEKLVKPVEEEIVNEVEPELPGLSEFLEEIKKECMSILSQLKFERRQEVDDAEFITNSIIKACELRDLMVVNGLVIGLKYISKKVKSIRYLVGELTNLIFDFYDNIETEEVVLDEGELDEIEDTEEENDKENDEE